MTTFDELKVSTVIRWLKVSRHTLPPCIKILICPNTLIKDQIFSDLNWLGHSVRILPIHLPNSDGGKGQLSVMTCHHIFCIFLHFFFLINITIKCLFKTKNIMADVQSGLKVVIEHLLAALLLTHNYIFTWLLCILYQRLSFSQSLTSIQVLDNNSMQVLDYLKIPILKMEAHPGRKQTSDEEVALIFHRIPPPAYK